MAAMTGVLPEGTGGEADDSSRPDQIRLHLAGVSDGPAGRPVSPDLFAHRQLPEHAARAAAAAPVRRPRQLRLAAGPGPLLDNRRNHLRHRPLLGRGPVCHRLRSEEPTPKLQLLMRIPYSV